MKALENLIKEVIIGIYIYKKKEWLASKEME